MTKPQNESCPCGSGQDFGQCCGPLLAGTKNAQTAVELMRSRYTAFVLADDGYLAASWHSKTRPVDSAAPSNIVWRRLRIRDVVAGGVADTTGEVEFVAHFRAADGTRDFLHERSRFVREQGRWVYVDGKLF